MNQHSQPTPPPSGDVPQLPPPQAGQQRPFTNLTCPQSQSVETDVLTCHLLSNQVIASGQMALAAQSSNRRDNIQISEHVPHYTVQHYPNPTMLPSMHHGGHDNGHYHGYYGNRPSAMVTLRNSTSTPSPSQQSMSPPPRSESVDSNMSVMSAESTSPAAVAHFNRFTSINATRGSCSSTSPLPQVASHFHYAASDRDSPKRTTYNVARESPQYCYPDAPHNQRRFHDDQRNLQLQCCCR